MIPQPLVNSDTSSLLYIANLNPWYHGLAPFSARAILGIEVDDQKLQVPSQRIPNGSLPLTSSYIKVYPNPSLGEVTIKTDQNLCSVNVINLQGSVVASYKSNNFNLSHLKAGLYLLQVHTEKETAFVKFYLTK